MSEIKIEKLDGRHAGSTLYSHRARMTGLASAPEWIQIRNWMWENYGPGMERDMVWIIKYNESTIAEPKWAWHIDNSKYYIYLKEEILTHFSLKYLNT